MRLSRLLPCLALVVVSGGCQQPTHIDADPPIVVSGGFTRTLGDPPIIVQGGGSASVASDPPIIVQGGGDAPSPSAAANPPIIISGG